MPPTRICLRAALALLVLAGSLSAAAPDSRPTEGLHHSQATLHALTGAEIVIKPGSRLENATLIVREGVIVAVGQGIEAPPGARVWDFTGRTIYPALIDPYGEADLPEIDSEKGLAHWNPLVRPQDRIADSYQANGDLNKSLRGQGIAVRLVAPSGGIIKGVSALVTTDDADHDDPVIREQAALHIRLTISRSGSRDRYPNSPMGAVALARQSFYDADWYHRAHEAYAKGGQVERPELNEALAALHAQRTNDALIMIDAANELFALRAADFAEEFQLKNVALRGSGKEYRRLEAIRQAEFPIVVPVNFPKPPNVASAAAAREVSLEDLMHWDIAPENPARMVEAGIAIALTSHGLKNRDDFLKQVRLAVERGLPAEEALRALTLAPAELLNCGDRLGSLEPGKAASLIVTDGDLFAEKTRVLETWIEGRRYPRHEATAGPLAGDWSLAVVGAAPEGARAPTRLKLNVKQGEEVSGAIHGKNEKNDGVEAELKNVEASRLRLEFTFDARPFGGEGVARFSMPAPESAEGKAAVVGRLVWTGGEEITLRATRAKTAAAADDDDSSDDKNPNEQESDDDDDSGGKDDTDNNDGDRDNDEKQPDSKPASFAVNFPLGAFGSESLPKQAPAVLLTNATVWTAGKAGTLQRASILIEAGVIKAVGKEIEPPAGAEVIDLEGMHVSPGIIDCHSHMATDGGINESSQAVTAEVRIGDFIDPDDITIYRQLAGGVTSANILHGSANPIGGQNQVIKLRWGAAPEGMKFAEAPAGIKFALGENVKQSNWGEEYTTRYPQTRMGVEQIIRDRFHAAIAYRARQKAWEENPQGLPPRRDLELEAIAEVVEGKRWIHCHSYRQDEILALIRTLDEFEITIGTFQHILEGYKVADAMARHGAMGSSFSDWWAYKFEVYDAIPYNGALMHRAGVVVSFNSDDDELGRHLNLEAAKAMKYGGVPAEEALKFVTLNPAKQLRIDQYVGSIEVGKHADLAVWSSSPLSTFTRCEQTWVDGRKYFDRQHDQQLRQQAAHMRHTLVQKILASGLEMMKPGEEEIDESELWPRHDEFCHGHQHGHDH